MSEEVARVTVQINIEDTAIQASIEEAVQEAVQEAMDAPVPTVGNEGVGALEGLSPELLMSSMSARSPTALLARLAPILGPAAIALMMPTIIETVVDALTAPGAPFDTRFKREMQKEQFGFYDRQLQYDTEYGYRQVIIQGVNGFRRDQGSFHASTFRDIMEGTGDQYRLSRIQITDKAHGVRGF